MMDHRPASYTAEHVVYTGPITGTVTLDDGTVVDVTAPVVEVASPEHGAAVAHAIGTHYVLNGHPTDDGFIYTPPVTGLPDGEIVMALTSNAGAAAALNGLDGTGATNLIGFVSLHTASPGTTGANESASTTRQACTWNAANTGTGTKTNSSTLTFTTPGTTACTHFGAQSLVSAGTYATGGALGSSITAVTITVAAGGLSLGAS